MDSRVNDLRSGMPKPSFQQRVSSVTDHRDKVIHLVKTKGPLLPVQINKELNTNVLFASAMLSELVDNKQLRLSYLKIGGSPLYYAPGQEDKLQQYAKHLPEKELKTYELLREKKVLRDRDQTPLVRATLREIKDYAVLLEVTSGGGVDLFWKWYLLPGEEAEQYISIWFEEQSSAAQSPPAKIPAQTQLEPQQELSPPLPTPGYREPRYDEPKMELKTTEELSKIAKEFIEKEGIKEILKESVKEKKEGVEKRENEKERTGEKQDHLKNEDLDKKESTSSTEMNGLLQDTAIKDKFLKKIKQFCDKSEIKIIDHKILRREADIELSLLIPSNVGLLHYFCKAKNKQRCNEGDVSTAYITSKAKNLPVLFLTAGDITKKAEDLARREFKTMTIKKI